MLIVVGIAMILQSAYFHGQDKEQQDCLRTNFVALSEALDVRGDLAEAESHSTRDVIESVSKSRTAKQVRAAFHRYNAEQARIQHRREQNPLPPYPPGACN